MRRNKYLERAGARCAYALPPHQRSLAGGAAEHFGDAGAGRGRGLVGQRVDGEEAVRHDLVVGHRRRHLAEVAHHEQRDMVAARSRGR